MPWCEDCSKFWNPSSLPVDGVCPGCGRKLESSATQGGADSRASRTDPTSGMGPDEVDTSIPWHFWVMVAALALYLGWRLIEGLAWLFSR